MGFVKFSSFDFNFNCTRQISSNIADFNLFLFFVNTLCLQYFLGGTES